MSEPLLHINIENTSNRDLVASAVTHGVPLGKGVLADDAGLAIELPSGDLQPVQTRALERWDDQSIKWLLLDFDMPIAANEAARVALVRAAVEPSDPISVTENDEQIIVRTARLEVSIPRKHFALFTSYTVSARQMIDGNGGDLVVESLDGKVFRASAAQSLDTRIIESGPQRVVVQASGRHTAPDGSELLSFRVRYTFGAHEPGVMLSYKFTNMDEPEQGVDLRVIHLELPLALGGDTTQLVRQGNHGKQWMSRLFATPREMEIVASGAANAEGEAPVDFGEAVDGSILVRDLDVFEEDLSAYPYFMRPGNVRSDVSGGLRRAYPYVAARSDAASMVAFFLEMSANFPKGLVCANGALRFDIQPAWAKPLRLRRGMSKEHDLYVALFAEPREHETLEGVYFDHELHGFTAGGPPVNITLDPDYVREMEILDLHRWLAYQEERYPLIEMKLGTLGRSPTGGQIGMLDYGDQVPPDRFQCANNENDVILQEVREYFRKAHYPYLQSALAKARHNAHVDFIAYDPDPTRQGTMPAHCPEHTDGATYPSHMWVEGLLATYCVTGNEDLRDAALSVGENLLRWQYDEKIIFYADSRECGWPMLAYVRLYDFTREQRWLDAAHDVFEFYREKADDEGRIRYALPHGVGISLRGYGEFIGYRACFFYYERTGDEDVKQFLVRVLDRTYQCTFDQLGSGGWATNDMFPAWAAYQLTHDDKYLEDNYSRLRVLMKLPQNIPWGGVDMMYYLHELDHRGVLQQFQQ